MAPRQRTACSSTSTRRSRPRRPAGQTLSGDGLDPRRRPSHRRGLGLRRPELRPRRGGVRGHQLSAGAAGVLRPPGADQGGKAGRTGRQLRPDGPDRGVEMGAAEHRRIRRRPLAMSPSSASSGRRRQHLALLATPAARGLGATRPSWNPAAAGREPVAWRSRRNSAPRRLAKIGVPATATARRPAGDSSRTSSRPRSTGDYGPFVDGRLMTETASQALADGHAADVPLIIGSNSGEDSLMGFGKLGPDAGKEYRAACQSRPTPRRPPRATTSWPAPSSPTG